MKITFPKGSIEEASKGVLRVRLTEESGVKRIVRENGAEWLEIGVGKGTEMTKRRFIILCRKIVRLAKEAKAKRVAVQFDTTPWLFTRLAKETMPEWVSQAAAENFVLANHEFRTYKSKPKEGWTDVEEILAYGRSDAPIQAAARKGLLVGEAVNACRELANTPGGDMTPKTLAKAAKDAVKGLPVRVTTLGKREMEKLSMGAVLGVAKGSSEEPTFTVMEYKGGGKSAPIVLAGKGVTFDSGGLNLKSESGIYEMHMDMSGAASVIHAVALAARLKLKKNVIGLIPAVENMPGNGAYRPGDVLRSMSGKTIEVLNTDAEGRLILADALTYAARFKPAIVIDVATLTGAAMVALGLHASGLMTRDDKLASTIEKLGEDSGDYVWRLPLWDEYEEGVKGTFADLANVPGNGSSSRYGGATNGGMFLWQFAKDLNCPWAHLDIAPRMTSAPGDELCKGAAGAPVRLLLKFIEQYSA
ncbi:MAG: leucyl aminopeptidase [Candidatus Pacebacteria bacterium]|nr:leucyl aminopeptidase [Candidatus Paceibacterota bacterium]MBP9840538.1 leucyl aminopeptidase [Candidatus Paceibacterota bacterium]